MPRYDNCLNSGGEYVENSLKNVESDNNKILYENLLDFFLQRNGTYFLNKPRILEFIYSEYISTSFFILLAPELFFFLILAHPVNKM